MAALGVHLQRPILVRVKSVERAQALGAVGLRRTWLGCGSGDRVSSVSEQCQRVPGTWRIKVEHTGPGPGPDPGSGPSGRIPVLEGKTSQFNGRMGGRGGADRRYRG